MAQKLLQINSSEPPTIEVDWDVGAAYLRFKKAPIAQTVERVAGGCLLTVDLDKRGEVIGVEVVGSAEIQIAKILKDAGVRAPRVDFSQARYVRPGAAKRPQKVAA